MRCLLYVAFIGGSSLVSFLATQNPGEKPKLDLTEERRQAFAWMTKLAYPETKDLKFVLVATGDWLQHGNNAPENRFQYGFLMDTRKETFKILGLDLEVYAFAKTPPKTDAYKTVDFEVLDLDTESRLLLADMKVEPNTEMKPSRRMHTIFAPGLSERTEIFLLAWACSRRGHNATAAKLYQLARNPETQSLRRGLQEKPVKTLQEKVADDLAHIEIWRGVLAFGDPRVPRVELLQRFERLAKNFPKNSHLDRAVETAVLLRKMIKEDEEHAASRKKGKSFDQLAKEEQITELIFQLREQNGHQFMQPGHCDIFDRFGGKDDSPAHKLVKFGYDAVPQLIEHLDDERFTRSVGFHRNFYFSHYVLRVNDCALAILEEIAGLSFWRGTSTFSYMSMDKKSGDAKKQAFAWFAEFQKKGEKGFLTEATELGGENSGEMARRLAERYPKEALPILMKGARATKVGHVRATMVDLVASFKGEESIQFLMAELKEGPLAQPRLTAAVALHKLGRPEGFAAMIDWWKKTADPKLDDENPASWSHYIAEYLAHCGELEGIQALAKDLRKRQIDVRLSVIDSVGGQQSYSIEPRAAKEPVNFAAAIEYLLMAALDDTEERRGTSGTRNGKEYIDPRVCDVAGFVLNELYPKKYTFDLAAQVRTRDLQLVVMKNIWRKRKQTAAIASPRTPENRAYWRR